jgi:small-conductance mechanosensitive channel
MRDNVNGKCGDSRLSIRTSMKTYILTTDFSILLSVFSIATIAFLVLRSLVPRLAARFAERFHIEKRLTDILDKHLKSLIGLAYFLTVIGILSAVPAVQKYAGPILDFPILDVETLRLSLSSLIRGILSFYILLVMMKAVRTVIRMYLFHRSEGREVASNIDIIIYNSALVLVVLLSLSLMGLSWKVLLPVAGALGIGIGFGVRDIANNFISGFVVLTSRTVKRGDWITLGDHFGKVVDIGIRTSTLRTLDNIDIIIPNSHLISNELINWSYTDNIVRIHVPVGVSYSSDTNLVRDTLLEVSHKSEYILSYPAPEARFIEFGDNSLNFELLVWIDLRKIKIPLMKSILNYAIRDAFREKRIEVPFPQRDIWFKNELKVDRGQSGSGPSGAAH